MQPIALIAIATLTLGIGILFWFAFGGATATRKQMLANLRRQQEQPKTAAPSPTDQQKKSGLSTMMRRGLPLPLVRTITRLWTGAGRPENNTPDRIMSMMALLGMAGAVVGFLISRMVAAPMGILFGIGICILGFFYPIVRLQSIGKDRREAIKRQLPDTLDQMSIAVNAGLGFDAAMVRVARNGRGELASELVRTLQDIQVGQARRVAYEDLAERTGVDTLRRFVRSIIQAEAYGIALSDVLMSQADELRLERRMYAERKAMEIPVKVVFPLLLFIMPAMFIVVMGPGAIGIIHAFSGMK
ncbi:MAG TPA: type II secretion system F family protein [Propionicimonas sp.]|jgi:tight adherence protein C|uniref:type II secretion system F family protein n=1 Tax=Propionicimonas sp. TaxID=1955623 RepID=UPI002F40BA5D